MRAGESKGENMRQIFDFTPKNSRSYLEISEKSLYIITASKKAVFFFAEKNSRHSRIELKKKAIYDIICKNNYAEGIYGESIQVL